MYNSDKIGSADSFAEDLAARTYCELCLRSLKKLTLTPFVAEKIAKTYLHFKSNKVASLIIIGKNNKVKDIVDFARDYKAKLDNFTDEILFIASQQKSSKFIVIFNFNHKKSGYDEFRDIDELYQKLKKHNVILCDVIKVINGNSTMFISPFNKSGYPRSK